MSGPFRALHSPLAGIAVLEPRQFTDPRGSFVKTYHASAWQEAGLKFELREEYYSVSRRGVLRGMHFQTPPADHTKVLFCPRGRVLDVWLDLRRNSPSYGRSAAMELSAANRLIAVIPSGIAHGFLALEDDCVLVYKTSSVHSPAHDSGVRWDSFGFDWGVTQPVLSERDATFPGLAEFVSPFP